MYIYIVSKYYWVYIGQYSRRWRQTAHKTVGYHLFSWNILSWETHWTNKWTRHFQVVIKYRRNVKLSDLENSGGRVCVSVSDFCNLVLSWYFLPFSVFTEPLFCLRSFLALFPPTSHFFYLKVVIFLTSVLVVYFQMPVFPFVCHIVSSNSVNPSLSCFT